MPRIPSNNQTAYDSYVVGVQQPTAFYKLDETSGTVAHDSSGHGNTAALSGGYTFTQNNIPSAVQQGIALDGVSGIVTAPNLGITSALTLEAWSYDAGRASGLQGVIQASQGAPNNFFNIEANDTQIRFQAVVSGGSATQTISAPCKGNWVYTAMAGASNGHSYGYYAVAGVDTSLHVVDLGSTGTGTLAPTSYTIGDWDNYFNGTVARAAYYNRQLGYEELNNNYHYGLLKAVSPLRMVSATKLLHQAHCNGGGAFIYQKIVSGLSYTIQSGDYFTIDVFIPSYSPYTVGSIDCQNGSTLKWRDEPLLDQNGVNCHPATDLSAYARNQWYHRVFSLASLVGGVVLEACAAFDGASYVGWYYAYFRNVAIWHADGTLAQDMFTNTLYETDGALGDGGANNFNVALQDPYPALVRQVPAVSRLVSPARLAVA